MINVTVDVPDFYKFAGERLRRIVDKAGVRAANATATTVRAEMQREVAESTGLKRKDIVSRLFLKKANRNEPVASIEVANRGIPLFKFQARKVRVQSNRGKRIGVTALVKGIRTFIPGAFIAEMPSGKKGVFERKTDQRLPIRQLFSNEVANFIRNQPGFLERYRGKAQGYLSQNFSREFKYFMSKEK